MHKETCERIEALLQSLSPTSVQVTDNSHLHVGHEGAKDGGGHFAVTVVADVFNGLLKIKRHRMVYQAVNELFESGAIHALEVEAVTHEEV
ncbi:BolA family protein [Marinicella rhabdoformis]|uniref:BolA family protein n=1 Tax=Marinicella rhabdoformis TaxID=2580566 RepID=UPI0012AEB22D|nr:BolA family protein [Marinicella rhabdoformis]